MLRRLSGVVAAIVQFRFLVSRCRFFVTIDIFVDIVVIHIVVVAVQTDVRMLTITVVGSGANIGSRAIAVIR